MEEDISSRFNETPQVQVITTKRPQYFSQAIAALLISLGPFSAGLAKGYSSPAIASLQENQWLNQTTPNRLQIDQQQGSWMVSLSLLGALFGAVLGGLAMRYGRRRVIIFVSTPLTISWLLTVFATTIQMLYMSAFIAGFCCSIIMLVTQVYISEISTSEIRGVMSALSKISNQIGLLISFCVGAFFNWRQLAAVIALSPILLCCGVFFLPESPSYLVLYGKHKQAANSLQWLRGPHVDIRLELATITANVQANKQMNIMRRQTTQEILQKLIGPIWITCGLMFFQRFSGAHSFNFYAVTIFRETFGSMNPHGAAIAVGFVQLLAALVSGLLIDILGRLPLLIASSVFMSLALAAFGSCAYYGSHQRFKSNLIESSMTINMTNAQYDWIPLLCVLVFTIAFTLGISPISWLLIGEMFPLEYRGLGSSLATAFSCACAFVNVKTFVDFKQMFGLHGAFWLYSAISILGLCFIVCFVPETKGREIDELNSTNCYRTPAHHLPLNQ